MTQMLLEIYRTKRRPLIAVAVLLLFVVVFSVVSSLYLSPAIAAAQARWTDLRQTLALAGRQDVSTAYRKGVADLTLVRGRIPLKRDFPRILGEILEMAATSRTTVGNMTYKPQVVKDEKLLAYAISMSVGGSYAAVKSLLADLSAFREMVVVDGITLTNNDLYEERVTLDLRLIVYLREEA